MLNWNTDKTKFLSRVSIDFSCFGTKCTFKYIWLAYHSEQKLLIVKTYIIRVEIGKIECVFCSVYANNIKDISLEELKFVIQYFMAKA